MKVLDQPKDVQKHVRKWKRSERIALVATMGALHDGHISLVQLAKQHSTRCIVSIFVNPKQFAPGEDFEKYPRQLDADLKKLEQNDVDLVFSPSAQSMYSVNAQTSVCIGMLGESLCGLSRPGHFEGVAIVCIKLFHITAADIAVFGEKDFQQVRVIEQLVADTDLDLEIIRAKIVREPDGLALSSRNAFLSEHERTQAAAIPKAIRTAQSMAREPVSVAQITETARRIIADAGLRTDYACIAGEKDLAPFADSIRCDRIERPRLFIAAFAGTTRLIDNGALYPEAVT